MQNIPDLEKLKYPIGKFDPAAMAVDQYLERAILDIETLPFKLQNTVNRMFDSQLDTPYRPGGWTVRQLVHHISDSHMNAYIRFKWTLTEDNPTIKPYYEERWAELSDSKAQVYISLNLLSSLHERWVVLMKALSEQEWHRTFTHPASGKSVSLKEMVGQYAWHGNHHLTHIRSLVHREHW